MTNLTTDSPLVEVLDNLIDAVEQQKSLSNRDIDITLDHLKVVAESLRTHNQTYAVRRSMAHTDKHDKPPINAVSTPEDLAWVLRLFRALPIQPDGINDDDEATAGKKTLYFTTTKPRKKKSQ